MRVRSIHDVAASVRGRREELELSQAELAERARVSRKWVYELEGGKPTVELGLLLRVLEVLDLSLDLAKDSAAGTSADLDALIEEHRGR